MKKFRIILIIFLSLLIISGGLVYLFWSFHQANWANVFFAGKPNFVIHAELAQNPVEWMRGLMFRKSMPADSGMLFIFSNEATQSFWMKNTKIPLDIIFISAAGKIVDLKNNFSPCAASLCPVYRSLAPAKYVLELNAGVIKDKAINIGDAVVIEK